jgi:hypothetical protein
LDNGSIALMTVSSSAIRYVCPSSLDTWSTSD